MAGFNPADYVDVQERINRFWKENPDGSIVTEFEKLDTEGKRVVVVANVWKKRPESSSFPDVTGIAMEIEGSSNVNKTSHIENCETSAIGRALANMGYAKTGKDRPSKQEMEKVERGEGTEKPAAKAHGKKTNTKPADDPMEKVIPSGKYKDRKVGSLNAEEATEILAKIPADSEFGRAVTQRVETINALATLEKAAPGSTAAIESLDAEAAK